MTEVTIAMAIAWWIGVYHMLIGGYLVFISERRTPFVVITGLVKGLLGAGIYLVIRQPLWFGTHAPPIPDVILPLTLLIMFTFSAIVTRLIWSAFDLDPPQDRAKELAYYAREWWRGRRHHFGR